MTHRKRSIAGIFAAVSGLMLIHAARAQRPSEMSGIVDRLPVDAMIVVAWDAGKETGAAFDQTSLGRIFHEPTVRDFSSSIWDTLWTWADEETDAEDERAMISAMRDWLGILTDSSGAMFLGPGEPDAQSIVNVGLVLDASAQEQDINAVLNRMYEATAPPVDQVIAGTRFNTSPDGALTWGWVGDYFIVNVGNVEPLVQGIRDRAPSLGASEEWKRRLEGVPMETESGLLYVDLARIAHFVPRAGGNEDDENWLKVAEALDRLGLATTEAFLVRYGFHGQDVQLHSTLFAHAPHNGIWRAIEGSVGPARMKLVPAGANWAGAGTFRPAEMLAAVMDTVNGLDPNMADRWEQRLHAIEENLGVAIREDILGNLTGRFTYYVLPSALIPPVAIWLDLKDERDFAAAMDDLEQFVIEKAPPGLATVQDEVIAGRNVTVHQWNLMSVGVPLVLRWAVIDRKWVLEAAGPGATHAFDSVIRNEDSLYDVPEFQARAAGFPDGTAFYSYSNDQARVSESLTYVGGLWVVFQSFVQSKANITLPFLPPTSFITQHLGTTGTYTYVDAAGLHTRTAGSLPITNAPVMAGGVGLAGAVLLPSLSRARELAKRTVSAANLKGVGTGCMIYAQNHGGAFPQSFETLIESGEITEKMLKNPRADEEMKDHYLYIRGLSSEETYENVEDPWRLAVAFENPALVDEGINVLFRDGHVEFLRGEAAFAPILDTYKALGMEPPALKYRERETSFLEQWLGGAD